MNSKHKPTYVYHSLSPPNTNEYNIYNLCTILFPLTTNEQIPYTIRVLFAFALNYEWTMFINILYTICFPSNYEWLPQIQTAHISPITTFTFMFICVFTHTYSLYDKSHVIHARIIRNQYVLKACTKFHIEKLNS